MAEKSSKKRATKSKKNRKFGRWGRKPHNLAYANQGRREKNKKRRIEKLIKRFPHYRAPGWTYNRATGKVEKNN